MQSMISTVFCILPCIIETLGISHKREIVDQGIDITPLGKMFGQNSSTQNVYERKKCFMYFTSSARKLLNNSDRSDVVLDLHFSQFFVFDRS